MSEVPGEIQTLETLTQTAQAIISTAKTGEEKVAANRLANLCSDLSKDDGRELARYINETLSAQMRNATTPTPRDLLEAFTRELTVRSTQEGEGLGAEVRDIMEEQMLIRSQFSVYRGVLGISSEE